MDKYAQITLPDPNDFDPHPSLLLAGDRIRAGECFSALTPDGWKEIRLELRWEIEGPACWYIAYPPELRHVCPVGLFVRQDG